MTKIILSTVDGRAASTDFVDPISTNHATQWQGTFGVIKTNQPTVDTATIPSGTNGISVGSITVSAGNTVRVNGEWRII